MKDYLVTFRKTEYATVTVKANSLEEAEKIADGYDTDDLDYEDSTYYGNELVSIEDEKGDERIYY